MLRHVFQRCPFSCYRLTIKTVKSDGVDCSFLQSCPTVDCWLLQCKAGLLEKGASVILTIRSRLWAETFMEVSLHEIKVCNTRPKKTQPRLMLYCPLWVGRDTTFRVPTTTKVKHWLNVAVWHSIIYKVYIQYINIL